MGIKFCRIDDRLIHGQVITTWVNRYDIEQIIVLNENISKDSLQKSILNMAAPAGIRVRVFAPREFARIAEKNPITRNTMLLFTTSEDVLELTEAGFRINNLNVGGMRNLEGREKITSSVFVSNDERKAFKKLLDNGLDITIQMVPNDEKILLEEVL